MSLKSAYWPVRFAQWGAASAEPGEEGYSLLLPVPGDLPVFLELALAVCRLQDPAHRVETLVIPDRLTPAVRRIVADAAPSWPGPLHLVPLPRLDRLVLPMLADGHKNHGAQLIQGVRRARADRILLHDADLFLMDPQVHVDEYTTAAKEDLDVLGISPAWDPWYAARGAELAATWEQVGRVAWFRSFPPHRHLGHDAVVGGERHTFDTTFWPQLHTPATARAVGVGLAERTVHFNYTIVTYRKYVAHCRQSSEPFPDSNFRILLIRLFVELFGGGEDYGLPSLEELTAGLEGERRGHLDTELDTELDGGRAGALDGRAGERRGVRVRYRRADAEAYRTMRAGLASVVQGPWSSPERSARCRDLLSAFDAHLLA